LKDIDVLQITETFMKEFESVKQTMQEANDLQTFSEREYIDLAHALELTSFDIQRGYRLAKELQQNRINRRNAKNLKEEIQPLMELMNRYNGFFKELKNVHAQIERTRHTQISRRYRPRERTDMEKEFEKAKVREG
jgi:hypothetical protein